MAVGCDILLHFAMPIDVVDAIFGEGQEPCLITRCRAFRALLAVSCFEAAIWLVARQTHVHDRGKWR